jgi:uncharacterized protein YbjT (DUF2867 family)
VERDRLTQAAKYVHVMSLQRVTVFGGTGFLGRRIVRHLHDTGFAVRIASRHPDRGRLLFSGDVSGIESVHADVNDDASVATVLSETWAVVNAVSFYVEHENVHFNRSTWTRPDA